jgi:hypothetical protein
VQLRQREEIQEVLRSVKYLYKSST